MEENKLMEIQRELMVCNKPSVYLEKIKNSYVDRATTIDGFLNICFKEEFIEEEIYYSIIEDDDYQLVKDVYIEEVRKLTNYLNDPRVSTQHGVKGESHDTVVFVADNSSNPAVHIWTT